MGVCDAKYCFTAVDIGDYGKNSDGGVFQNWEFGARILDETLAIPGKNKIFFKTCFLFFYCIAGLKKLPGSEILLPHVFVADEAFPLRHTVMRPFPGSRKGLLAEDKRVFNYRLSRARRIIENSFGILVARWQILKKPIEAFPENANAIVGALIVLHNYLKKTDATETAQARYVPPCFVDYEDSDGILQKGEWRNVVTNMSALSKKAKGKQSNNYDSASREIREGFMKFFLTSEGEVPWQYVVANRGLE